jgi:hypothetical protein
MRSVASNISVEEIPEVKQLSEDIRSNMPNKALQPTPKNGEPEL